MNLPEAVIVRLKPMRKPSDYVVMRLHLDDGDLVSTETLYTAPDLSSAESYLASIGVTDYTLCDDQ